CCVRDSLQDVRPCASIRFRQRHCDSGHRVLAFIIQRLLQALVVMLVISALVFAGVYAVGNPIDVMISPDATQQIREQAIRAYGFDQPLWLQYVTFLKRLVMGDFGRSFVYNTPVLGLILSRLPATLEITLAA